MKKYILLLTIVLLAFITNAQVWTEIPAGKYYVSTTKNDSDIVKKSTRLTSFWTYTGTGSLVADTVFYIPSTAPNDTIPTLMTAANNQGDAAILIERGSTRRTAITVSQDSLKFSSYGSGEKPIITGSDVITGMVSTASAPVSDWNYTLNTDYANGIYYNYRQVLPASKMNVAGDSIRILLYAHSASNTTISGASIGKRNGYTDDFNGAPTRITFDGGSNSTTVLAGINKYSDFIAYVPDTTVSQLVHLYMNVASPFRYVTAGDSSYRGSNNFDYTLTQTLDFGTGGTTVRIIGGYEVKSASAPLWVKTGITNQPYIAWINDSLGTLVNSVAELDSITKWYWSGDSLYVYSPTDPSGNVEIGQRDILVELGATDDYVTLKNLTIQHSNSIALSIESATIRGSIYMYGGDNLSVINCDIKDNSYHGLHVINSSNLLVDHNTFLRNGVDYIGRNANITSLNVAMDNVIFSNNTSNYAGADGCMIYASNIANRMTNIDIHGNTFNYNKAAGAYSIKSDTVVIYDNTFYGNGDAVETGEDYGIGVQSVNNIDIYNNTVTNQLYNDGIQIFAKTGEVGHNVRIFRNYVSGMIDGDCLEVISDGELSMENCEVFSNVFANASNQGITASTRNVTGVIYPVAIYNNTIYGNDIGIYKYSDMPIVITNNIFSGGRYSVNAAGAVGSITGSNNLWYNPSVYALVYNGTNYTTATITNFEATAQTGNPLFTNAATGDFTLQTGSPAINNGINTGITVDILGNPIPSGGGYDIGAYEKQ